MRASRILLLPQQVVDLPLLTLGDSVFEDFGPRPPRTVPAPCALEGDGALTVTNDGEVAGGVSWRWKRWGPNEASGCPMIGIWLRREHRGRGLGSVAQAALVDLLFTHTTAHRVEAWTDVDNLAEQRALEKAGLLREGVTRGAQYRQGSYHDGALYAVLRADPRPPACPPSSEVPAKSSGEASPVSPVNGGDR